MAHTSLKLLNEKGAKLLILVPGAGLEPARTLPGPRDFKSTNYYHQPTVTDRKALYQRGFPRWYGASLLLPASWFSYSVSYSTTTGMTLTIPRALDELSGLRFVMFGDRSPET